MLTFLAPIALTLAQATTGAPPLPKLTLEQSSALRCSVAFGIVHRQQADGVLVGRRWFGDRFDVENDRTYEFNFPNIVNSEQMLVKVYAAAASESSTTLNVNINGEDVDDIFWSHCRNILRKC